MDLFIQRICDKQFSKEVVQCIEINDQETINQLIQAVSKIMKEKHPPKECVFGLKMVKDGIEKFNDKFKDLVRTELMDSITEVALFRIKDHDDQRGVSYFKNPEHDRTIDSLGASYIRLALDCVRVWARWFPEFQPYLEKLNKQNGYLPPINYFKPEIIEQFAQKFVTPTPKDEADQVQMKIEQINQQLQALLSSSNDENGYVKDQLALINAQLEDIFVINDQDQFVGDFVLSYQDYIQGEKPYPVLREQFLKNNLKKSLQFQQASKIQQPQKQEQQPSSINEANLQKSEFNSKLEVLQKELQQKNQLIQKLQDDLEKSKQQHFERNNELQHAIQQISNLQKENKDLTNKIVQEQAYFQGQLQEQQQQLEFHQKENQKLQENNQVNNQPDIIYGNQNQVQQLQEELENLKVEKNLLQEQNKQYQQRSTQLCNQQDYENLKKRFDELDSKYYILKQENFKLRQANQDLGNQSFNQSRMNENIPDSEFRVINPNINFYNFKDSDLWSVRSVSIPSSSVMEQNKDISQIIYPHKSAAEYYRATGKKQFKGTLIQRTQFPIELNQTNQINFKKASLNQVASLFQTNKIEIKSRQQLLTAPNKQEFISTTLSIKNKDLAKVQLQIINNSNNVWINKDTKSTVLQSQQTISYEFIRESNVKLHQLTQVTLSVNFTPTVIYLPNFLMNCIKFTQINAETFKQIKKQFQGTIYKTTLQLIVCQPEILLLKKQGTLLNNWQSENDDQITPNKFGFKAILCNQLEFYLELITTPCDEFLFRGFTSYDEEYLQFILNILSNLYGV